MYLVFSVTEAVAWHGEIHFGYIVNIARASQRCGRESFFPKTLQ